MNVKEIREKTAAELNETLDSLKKELFRLRFQNAINQLENPMRISAVKKDIAKVKTVLREREIQETSANS
ncbi:MAG: 50S ribosomal protein L29 [Clostridia bacterium]|nr:50S ribosomal protein L29 [Clostridia bacterium]